MVSCETCQNHEALERQIQQGLKDIKELFIKMDTLNEKQIRNDQNYEMLQIQVNQGDKNVKELNIKTDAGNERQIRTEMKLDNLTCSNQEIKNDIKVVRDTLNAFMEKPKKRFDAVATGIAVSIGSYVVIGMITMFIVYFK